MRDDSQGTLNLSETDAMKPVHTHTHTHTHTYAHAREDPDTGLGRTSIGGGETKNRHEKTRYSENEWMATYSPDTEGASTVTATLLPIERG